MTNHARITHNILLNAYKLHDKYLAFTSSFQTQSAPLLHMISRWCPDVRVWFLDTGFHFEETIAYKNKLSALFNLQVLDIRAAYSLGRIYENSVRNCCIWYKTLPLNNALVENDITGWISGVRADQTEFRAGLKQYEQHDNIERISPMLHWTAQDVADYIKKHKLPEHPLTAQGYASIGCAPCTEPGSEREGRWPDSAKVECGMHK